MATSSSNNSKVFNQCDCNTKSAVVMAATFRNGAGIHKSGPRGGQRNELRDMLDEYYAEQTCTDDNSQPD